MSLSKTIANIRKKPRRVRERILLFSIVIAIPVLFVVWYATFSYSASKNGQSIFKDMAGMVSTSFANPIYTSAFGDPSLIKKKLPDASGPAAPEVAETASGTPAVPLGADQTPPQTGTQNTPSAQ